MPPKSRRSYLIVICLKLFVALWAFVGYCWGCGLGIVSEEDHSLPTLQPTAATAIARLPAQTLHIVSVFTITAKIGFVRWLLLCWLGRNHAQLEPTIVTEASLTGMLGRQGTCGKYERIGRAQI